MTPDLEKLQALRDEVATLKQLASGSLDATDCKGHCGSSCCPHAVLRKYIEAKHD